MTVYVSQGTITNVTVVDQGSGYSNRPLNLDFGLSGGTGAAATVTLDANGQITQANITQKGTNYLGGKSGYFVITPKGESTEAALLSVSVTQGEITDITILNGGQGYKSSGISLDFSQNGGGGTGATATAQPIATELINLVNDGPPSISSITYPVNQTLQTATTMAWVADGIDNITPLTNQSKNKAVITRLQTAVLSGTDWSAPEPVPGQGSRGFNFDPAIGYYLDQLGNPVRVLVWAHADASDLNPNSSGDEITDALLATDIYYSIAPSGQAWSSPQLLAANVGTDTKVTLGAGTTSGELIATWVNTALPDPATGDTSQSLYTTIWNGQSQAWSTPTVIPNVGDASGSAIASLEVGEFQGNPAIFWSDTTAPAYAYSVLQDSPDIYYRFDDPLGATVSLNLASGGVTGNAAYVGSANFGQPGALIAANGGGDPNTSIGLNGNGYVLMPGVDSQSSLGDFSVEFWVNLDNFNSGQSLVDQGVYNPDAILPTATIPLTIVKAPTQQNGVWGYAYAVSILANTEITVTNAGAGLSPFNLDLNTLLPGTVVTLVDGTKVTLSGVPLLNLNIEDQQLKGIAPPEATQILGTTFVANPFAEVAHTSTTTQTESLSFTQVTGWSIRTGNNNNIVFNAGGGDAVSGSLNPNTWYYVAATYNSSTQVASLYVNGELVAQQTGSRFAPNAVPVVLGYNVQGQLDEFAYYNTLLTPNTNSGSLNSQGQVSSLGFNSLGQITEHFANRYNNPNSAEDATFYSVYDPTTQAWSSPIQFTAQAAVEATNPLLERSPAVDITSTNPNQLRPDGVIDTHIQVVLNPSIVAPGVTITGIEIQNAAATQAWTVGDVTATSQGLVGVVANGQLLNPINPSSNFAYTVISNGTTLDLYFQSNLALGSEVEVTFTTVSSTGGQQTSTPVNTTVIPNPVSSIAQATTAGQELVAIGGILENEVTALAQVDSGVILNTPDSAGLAVAAGNFLNNQVALAVTMPSGNAGEGAIWVLPAGSNDILDLLATETLSTTPPTDGILIKGDRSDSSHPQTGNVLAVGDVNGDGIEDLIIGASQANNQAGKVYILSGATLTPNNTIDLINNPGVTLLGTTGSQAGFAIATGDVNGDGIADIVVGAPYASYGGQQVGAAYLVLGGNNFFNTPTVNLNSSNLLLQGTSGTYIDQYIQTVTWTSQVGFSVAVSRGTQGKSNSVNGDSYADIVIGAPHYRQTVEFSGDGFNQNATKSQYTAYSKLLTTIANTGRGYSYSANANTGRAYILFGSSVVPNNLTETELNGTNGVILDGSPMLLTDMQTGFAVGTGGDLNGDGFDDVVVGAPAGNNETGITLVLSGQAQGSSFQQQYVLTQQANLVVGGSDTFAQAGKTLSLVGDVNGDGIDDLLVGAPNATYSTGEAHILFGQDSIFPSSSPKYFSFQPGATTAALNLNGGISGNLAAAAVSSGVDINGDGIEDLLLSAPYGGKLYGVFGHQWLSNDGNLKLTNLANDQGIFLDQSGSGNGVANLGDINGDGYADTLLSLTNQSATVVLGGGTQTVLDESLNTSNLQITPISGTTLNQAHAIGDFNGDGLADALLTQTSAVQASIVNGNIGVIEREDGNTQLSVWVGENTGFGNLYYSESTDGINWSQPATISYGSTNTTPGLVSFEGRIWAYWYGSGNDGLFYSVYYGSGVWTEQAKANLAMATSSGVSVAAFNSTLFAIWKGEKGDQSIWYSYSQDGQNWVDQIQFPGTPIYYNSIPNLVSYNNQLFAYWYADTNNGFHYAVWDEASSSWSGEQRANLEYFGNVIETGGISFTEVNGILYASWVDYYQNLYTASSTDGSNWTTPVLQPNSSLFSNTAPVGLPGMTTLNSQPYVLWAVGDNGNVTAIQSAVAGNNTASLIATSQDYSSQIISLALGNTSLSAAQSFNLGGASSFLSQQSFSKLTKAGDLNADGYADIVGLSNGNTYVSFGNSAGTLGNFYKLNTNTYTSLNAAGDINGDGIDDLVLGNGNANGNLGAAFVIFGNTDITNQLESGTAITANSTVNGATNSFTPNSSGLAWSSQVDTGVNGNIQYLFNGGFGLSTVEHNGRLFSVWLSADGSGTFSNNGQVEYSVSNDGVNWSGRQQVGGSSKAAPALVVFNNDLLAFWYGINDDGLFYSTYGGAGFGWNPQFKANLDFGTSSGLSLTVYNNTLFAVWKGFRSDSNLYYAFSSDAQNWSAQAPIPGVGTFGLSNVPTVAVFNNTLFAYWYGSGQEGFFYSTYNQGTNSWSSPQLISNLTFGNGASTEYGISTTVLSNQRLYMTWANNETVYSSSSADGVNWDTPTQLSFRAGGVPGISAFQNQLNQVWIDATVPGNFVVSHSQRLVYQPEFGSQVTTVGDVNGDGFADVVVGSPSYASSPGDLVGTAYLLLGSATGFASQSVQLKGADLTQATFSQAGDINGDGFDDVLIASPNYNSGTYGNNAGITYVVFGSRDLGTLSSINLSQLQPINITSGTITDGKIGAISLTARGSGYLNGGSGTFEIFVTSSTSTQPGVILATVSQGQIQTILVENPGAGFTSLNNLVFDYSQGGGGTGANISVTSLISLAGFQIVGLENSKAGSSLSGGGDVNGDGFDDLVIGAPGDNLSYVLFGGDFTASVNQYGSIGDDTLLGTATGDVLLGQSGDDTLLGNGGYDVLLGGVGNDWLQVQDTNFRRVDGGSGTDTLALYGYNGQAWDLTTLAPGSRLQDLEVLDIRNHGSNLLGLNSVTILKLSSNTNILTINGDSTDRINLSPDFNANGNQYISGENYAVYQAGAAQVWINTVIPIANISFNAPVTNSPIPLLSSSSDVATFFSLSGLDATVTNHNQASSTAATKTKPQPTQFHVSSPVMSENHQNLVFTVSRSGDLTKAAAVRYRTINSTAHAGSHYHGQVGYVHFAAGETEAKVKINLIDDDVLGPRLKQMSLGITPLPDEQATAITDRSLHFNTDVDNQVQLRNLDMINLAPSESLNLGSYLPFGIQNFKVAVPGEKTILTLPFTGVHDLNSYYRFNAQTSRYEEFLYNGQTGIEFVDTDDDGLTDTLKLHLLDGGSGDSDKVANGVIAGTSAPSQVTPGPVEVNAGIFYIPTASDSALQFHNVTAKGAYRFGVFQVDDAQGRIGNLLPTDPGYAAAAQARHQTIFQNASASNLNALTTNAAQAALQDPQLLVQSEFQTNGAFQATNLIGNQYYGMFLSQNGQTQLSTSDPAFEAEADSRGYFELRWSNTQFEVGTPVLVTPGQAGQTITARFELARGGAYNNTLALFQVDSLTGGLDTTGDGVIDLKPGDTSYTQAVMERIQDPLTGKLLPTVPTIFTSQGQSVVLPSGALYGMALITNGSLDQFLGTNPSNASTGSIHTFFSFEAANPDGVAHVRRLGNTLWGFEDIFGGGDRDYNDMVLQATFASF
ncbi:FG-GAP-like repeat-containing protein [Synechococcus sp. PCC 6312]|uniref:FG-GAP-like repeat-containing protein n=1 Tax=Synechococcus sp. (strain ATCC 27167 / PCC 6312) TaxID=195253 RepID=UPI00030520DA|nr:FG-GAP-like repeat-containing protein [Synechococcus sp. PCC 6312]